MDDDLGFLRNQEVIYYDYKGEGFDNSQQVEFY
jgi:hypothetical protein